MRRRLLILLTVAIAGCGGSASSGEQAVRRTLTGFLAAVAQGDGMTACRLVTPAGRAALETQFASMLGARRRVTCEQIIPVLARLLPATEQAGLRTAAVRRVSIDGDRATVAGKDIVSTSGSVAGFAKTTRLRRVGGAWQID